MGIEKLPLSLFYRLNACQRSSVPDIFVKISYYYTSI